MGINFEADDKEFIRSLQIEFYDEAKDSLTECEGVILKWDSEKDEEHLKEYMRILHSMKGSARAVDMHKMAEVIHLMESKCSNMPDNFVDLTLAGIDRLQEYVSHMNDENEAEADPILDELLEKFK